MGGPRTPSTRAAVTVSSRTRACASRSTSRSIATPSSRRSSMAMPWPTPRPSPASPPATRRKSPTLRHRAGQGHAGGGGLAGPRSRHSREGRRAPGHAAPLPEQALRTGLRRGDAGRGRDAEGSGRPGHGPAHRLRHPPADGDQGHPALRRRVHELPDEQQPGRRRLPAGLDGAFADQLGALPARAARALQGHPAGARPPQAPRAPSRPPAQRPRLGSRRVALPGDQDLCAQPAGGQLHAPDRAQHGLPRSGADEVAGRDAALSPATAAAHPLRRLGRGDRGVLSRSPHRRSHRAPCRPVGHPGGDRSHASPPGTRSPVARPVRRLPLRHAARRFRAVDPAAAPRHAARARASLARHRRAGRGRHRALHPARHPARHRGRHPSESSSRPPQSSRFAPSPIHAELLARAGAHPRLRRPAERALARVRRGNVATPDPARGDPGRRSPRAERPAPPRRVAGCPAPGLHPDGAREGAARASHPVSPRDLEHGHPVPHRHRSVRGLHAERRHRDRDRLLVAGARTPHRPGHSGPRLSRHPGGRLRLRADLRARQSRRGPPLRGGRSAGPALLMPRAGAAKRLRRDGAAILGLLVLVAALGAALLAPVLSPRDPVKNDLLGRLSPPMWLDGGDSAHPLGTDTLGRDVLSRLLYGARVSLWIGLTAVTIAAILGVPIGLWTGYRGGWSDDLFMRLGDIQLAFPVLLLGIALLAVLGASLANLILVLGVSGWITYARIVRGETLSLKERGFVEAARALGAADRYLIFRHILPNVWAPIVVVATFSIARVIIAEASLSFLGLGLPPPAPSWGAMLDEGRNYLTTGWWLAFFPGLAILLVVLGINLVGDWLRDLLDPQLERGI